MRRLWLPWIVLAVLSVACASPPAPASPTPSATPTLLPATPTPTSTIVTRVPPTATAVPATATAVRPAGARTGGTLDLAARANITHQDVHLDSSPALTAWGPGLAYSRLLRFRSGPHVGLPSLEVECDLCAGWSMEDDRTFLFRLRDDIVWQDLSPVRGRDLGADDVVYSYRRLLESRGGAGPLGVIELVEPAGSREVRIRLADSDADFLVSLADGRAKIVAWEAVEANGDLKQGPTVGSGPWRMTDSIRSAFHRFERNATYFEEDLPFADALMMHIMPDASTRYAAFDVGTLDVHQLDPDEWGRLVQRRPDVRSTLVRESGVGLEVALNTSRSPFHDVDVRRAVFRAMDPWAAIDQTWSGTAYVSAGIPVIEPDWLLDDRDLRPFFAQPQRARDLLEAGGYGAAHSIAITVGDFGGRYLAHAQRIAMELEAVGFEPTVNVVNQRRFGEAVWLGGDYQMFVGPVAPVTSPNGYLVPVLHSLGAWNTTAHADEDLDALIEAQAREPDPVERARLIRDIQEVVLDRAYRFMPATRKSIWASWPRVRNFHPNFGGLEYGHWARVWLDD